MSGIADTGDRYELTVDGETAFAAYRDEGDVRVITHTEVPPALGGQGIGSRLVRAALGDIRAKGLKLRPQCPFVAAFLEKNPDFSDILES